MDIRPLLNGYAVSPQIAPDDLPQIAAAGYTTLINNRPDAEIPGELSGEVMRIAAEAAGLAYIANPVNGGAMTQENVALQAASVAEATGPVLAYCNSGTRSTVVWLFSQAGQQDTDALLEAARAAGYMLDGMRPQIEHLAAQAK